MRYLAVLPLFIVILAAIILVPKPLLDGLNGDQIDVNPMLSDCVSACSSLINTFRASPDTSIFDGSDYCTLYYDTSSDGGLFVDHCYSEPSDVLRSDCNIAMLNGTVVGVGC